MTSAPLLESYVAGRWFAAADDGAPVARQVATPVVVPPPSRRPLVVASRPVGGAERLCVGRAARR